jgi:methyl farnesoate epoxidase / farnesoate epoxidase
VLINLHSVHNEAEYWKDPHLFRPERHLSAEGKITRTDHFLPFGAGKFSGSTSSKRPNKLLVFTGKRMCIGEPLAKNTYHLFVAALVKTFRFSAVAGQPLPTLNPVNGFTLGYEGFLAVTHLR